MASSLLTLLAVLLATYFLRRIYIAHFSPLARFPGPWLAKYSNLWYLYVSQRPFYHERVYGYHKRYPGGVIRTGPNTLDLAESRWIKTIMSTNIKTAWKKASWYSVNDAMLENGAIVETNFSTRDEYTHKAMLEPVQRLYNIGNMLQYEPRFDEVLGILIKTLDTFAGARTRCDIGRQLLYAAYDMLGNANLGAPFGYLEKQADFDGGIRTAEGVMDYFVVVQKFPWMDRVLAKSPFAAVRRLFPNLSESIGSRSVALTLARVAELKQRKETKTELHHADFLNDCLEAFEGNPQQVVPWLMVNIIAGADTTAIALRAFVYHVLTHPSVHAKLTQEIDAAQLSIPVPYEEARARLPYFAAVLKESMRLHAPLSAPLDREVPAGGAQLPDGGPFLPGGTDVGMNPWIVNRDPRAFGADAETFNPDRWSRRDGESEAEATARLASMNEAGLTFGAGRRICIGRWQAQVQLYKTLPTLFALYKMELADRNKEWTLTNRFFLAQEGIEVLIERRK